MNVIGIAGKARSGKHTAAKYISDALADEGIECFEYAFADPLKDFLSKAFGCTEEQLYGDKKEREAYFETYMSNISCVVWNMFREHLDSRSDLQQSVQYLKDVLEEHFMVEGNWLSPLIGFHASTRRLLQVAGTEWAQGFFGEDIWLSFAEKEAQKYPEKTMIVPDVRFVHEAQWCKDKGVLLNIQRDTSEYGVYSKHSSESQFDSFANLADDIIMNYGGLESLQMECKSIAFSIKCGAYASVGCGK